MCVSSFDILWGVIINHKINLYERLTFGVSRFNLHLVSTDPDSWFKY